MNEWSLLVLYYLGINHIDHSQRAMNTLIKEKSFQTDKVIYKIV